jgi:dihydropteroate synthase
MGILNVTPDSFFDGGKYFNPKDALERARLMIQQGADIIDVGGESTRPGSSEVPIEEEINRVSTIIKQIKDNFSVKVSCDTSKPEVAAEAVASGADMINDVRGFRDPLMRKVAAETGAFVCIMHMRGNPDTMQNKPHYSDVLAEIKDFLYNQARVCEEDGIAPENIFIDPGIGFGKTLEHNLKILANADYFNEKYPVLIGASRKSFLDKLLGIPVEERLPGSLAVAGFCVLKNVSILRVHDVKETKEVIEVIRALKENENR